MTPARNTRAAAGESQSPTALDLPRARAREKGYAGRVPVYHFDTYRLRDVDEFEQLGADELMESDGICLIEWADRVAETLPRDHLKIDIEITGENERRFRISASGAKSHALLTRLRDSY